MQDVDPLARRYDGFTQFAHWATAILVAEQWLGAQVIDWFPSGAPRVNARSVHITLGVALALLLVARLCWRLTRGRRLPLADRGALNVAAKATHWGLYALLVAMVTVGAFLTWTRGDVIFNLFKLPQFRPGDRTLVHPTESLHATLGYVILAVAGVHAAAALVHRYVWRDGVLARMLPGRG